MLNGFARISFCGWRCGASNGQVVDNIEASGGIARFIVFVPSDALGAWQWVVVGRGAGGGAAGRSRKGPNREKQPANLGESEGAVSRHRVCGVKN